MRLALFISSLHTGGAQRQILALAAGLPKRGREAQLICIYPDGKFWQLAIENPGIRVASLFDERPATRLGRALGLLWAPVLLRRKVVNEQIGVLYSMLDLSNLIARLAVIGRKGPVLIWGIRSTIFHADYRAVVPFRLCKWLSRSIPAVISNSQKALDEHRTAGFQMVREFVVYNGFDLERFRFDKNGRRDLRRQWSLTNDDALIALVGRLHERKGHEQLIRMAASLRGTRQDLMFAIVGPGPIELQRRLEDLTIELGIETIVRFTGPMDNMSAVYSAADVIVSCSTGEGLPNVVGEAMSCSRACVVTDAGDSTVLVGDCGVVVPPNATAALADAVVSALDRRLELGECGRRRIKNEFSVDAMLSNTIKSIDKCLSELST